MILAIFGAVWGPGGSGEMADRPGKGQLRAWQGSGEGSGTEVGNGSGSDFGHFGPRGQNLRVRDRILAILGHFGGILGSLASDPTQITQGPERNSP